MKVKNRIVNYLRGDRKGKEANSLEKEALNDAFLYEALEGLAGVQRDVVRDIEYLSKRLREKTKSRREIIGKAWKIAAVSVAVGFGVWLGFRQMQTVGVRQRVVAAGLAENEIPERGITEKNDTSMTGGNEEQRQTAETDTVRVWRRPESPVSSTVAEGNRGSVPFGGYEKFYRYIQDSLRYPQDALEQELEGEIKLSFYVNKAGRPSHIRVVKWITYSCNREAIRLLSEGPAWNYTGDTSYVVIPFHLKK